MRHRSLAIGLALGWSASRSHRRLSGGYSRESYRLVANTAVELLRRYGDVPAGPPSPRTA